MPLDTSRTPLGLCLLVPALYRAGDGIYPPPLGQGDRDRAAAPLFSDRMIWGVPGTKRARWLERRGAEEVIVLEVPLWP